jgi:hypothetical protein
VTGAARSDSPLGETQQPRIVLVVRRRLPANQATNAAAVLAATIAAKLDLPLGPDAEDGSGTRFPGIVTTPVPVLVADQAGLADLFHKANGDPTLQVACLTEVARRARSYRSYLEDLAVVTEADADIVAICVAGPRSRVTKLTKRLPLLGDGDPMERAWGARVAEQPG